LRAAPKKRLGFFQRVGVDASGQDLAAGRHDGIVGACEARDTVKQDDHILLVFDEALRLSMTISATWTCLEAGSSNVELITSPFTDRSMSVTSSGRSSIRRTIR